MAANLFYSSSIPDISNILDRFSGCAFIQRICDVLLNGPEDVRLSEEAIDICELKLTPMTCVAYLKLTKTLTISITMSDTDHGLGSSAQNDDRESDGLARTGFPLSTYRQNL